MHVAGPAADVGLVHLDRPGEVAHAFGGERLPDAVAEVPRRLLCDAEIAGELDAADPVGAGNSAVVVDLPRCRLMLSPRAPNLVPIPCITDSAYCAVRPLEGP